MPSLCPQMQNVLRDLAGNTETYGTGRISQLGLPVLFTGTGLPSVVRKAGDAKPYAEQLIRFFETGAVPFTHSI